MNKTERKLLGQVAGKWLKPDADVEECRVGKNRVRLGGRSGEVVRRRMKPTEL